MQIHHLLQKIHYFNKWIHSKPESVNTRLLIFMLLDTVSYEKQYSLS